MTDGLIEILSKFGYEYEGSCNCDGYKTMKYKNSSYQFRWRVKAGTFKIRQYGITKTNWSTIDKAEDSLNKFHVAVQA